MPSPMHGCRPPYRLLSNIVYFHDWRYVNHGAPVTLRFRMRCAEIYSVAFGGR